jgi:putative transcription factor
MTSGAQTVDWDSKVVIGSKARVPKVTRNTSDLNGMLPRAHGLHPR